MIWKYEGVKKLNYEDIFALLDKANIKYLLIGGLAVILHGIPRSTGDVDLMLLMTQENIKKFVAIMGKLGYQPKVPVKPIELANPRKRKYWQEKKNMKVFSFQHPDDPVMVIDIMINDLLDFKQAFKERKIVDRWGVKISLASKKAIIELKKIAGRPQDLSDIEMLEKAEEIEKK